MQTKNFGSLADQVVQRRRDRSAEDELRADQDNGGPRPPRAPQASASVVPAEDVAFIHQGLWRSRARIDGAFAVRCEAHDAAPGSPCWGSRLSGVYGLCQARYTVGIAAASRARFPLSLEDDLAERARIARLKNDRIRASLLQVADRETRARRAAPQTTRAIDEAEHNARRVDRIREHNAAPKGKGAMIRVHVINEALR